MTFVWGDDLSLPEILRRSAGLPDHSAILFMSFGTDAGGAAYADERVLGDLNTTARAPVFGLQSTYLGAGVVGGLLMRMDELTLRTADVAIRLLNGASPRSLTDPTTSRSPDSRLARVTALGDFREPVAAG